MRLLGEVLVALGIGAAVFVVARRVGMGAQRALGAVVLVPIAIAIVLAAPTFRDDLTSLRDQRREYAPLSRYQAEVRPGSEMGFAVDFLAWVKAQFAPEDTFHIEVGRVPDETDVAGVGVRQGAIMQWSLFQLAPHLAVEQSAKARDLKPGEGHNADWFVFYESEPTELPALRFSDAMTYAPGFSIARARLAR